MVKYNEVKEVFENWGCILLMSEEEFDLEPRITKEKYKYTAQCNHNHEIWFHIFKSSSSGRICPDCVHLNCSKNQKERLKLNPLSNNDLEYSSIEYLKSIIGDSFDVKINSEDCLSDCCIKPKHITEDKWLMIQMKSTLKPICTYSFHCSPRYKDCIIMCVCVSDKKMWLFDGNTIITKKISIGLSKSKYDEFEITKNIIHEKITYYYNTFPKYDFETTDIPITQNCKLEWEYRIYRETMITCIPFIRNERQGLVYDFVVNGYKVQEKVGYKKTKNGVSFTLDKRNGKINGVRQSISYKTGDNDFYWLNVNDKKYFYIIPEHELLSRNYINTVKQSAIYLTPNAKKNSKHFWANEYLFDYTKIDEEKLKKMFH